MKDAFIKQLMLYGAIGIVGYLIYRKLKVTLPAIGTQASSALIDVMNRPSLVTNTAAQEANAYEQAVQQIIAANPQFQPDYVKKLLVYFNWHLGDPMPDASGLIAPQGM